MVRVLEKLKAERVIPEEIGVDQGLEFISKAIDTKQIRGFKGITSSRLIQFLSGKKSGVCSDQIYAVIVCVGTEAYAKTLVMIFDSYTR
jgi:hypothetical protein